jgi:hypothetical protein
MSARITANARTSWRRLADDRNNGTDKKKACR